MRLLLDTQVLLWWFLRPSRIEKGVAKLIGKGTTAVWFSAASVWEVEIKTGLGKLKAPSNLLETAAESRFTELPVAASHAIALRSLPGVHRDPFDRILVAQARAENLTLVTADERLTGYPVATLLT